MLVVVLPTLLSAAVPQNSPPQEIGVAELPYGFSEQIVATGLDVATAMAVAPDRRVFICEQTGTLRLVQNDKLVAGPVLKLKVDSYWERGLIGIALDPEFEQNQHIYVCYVAPEPYPHHIISRFTLDGNVADPASEKVLLEGDDQTKLGGSVPAGHQGGAMCFGHDGKLYIGLGEQTAGAPSQRLDSLLGKLLRINPDGSIPRDNPFYEQADGKYRAIYARGLRNPFGLAVEPSTGRIFFNDVGGSNWEEVNVVRAGANYGWPHGEGPTTHEDHTPPIHAYALGGQQSITGGLFYQRASRAGPGSADGGLHFPAEYHGKYFFADYSEGWLRVLDPENPGDVHIQTFATGLHRPVALALAPDGSLYYLNRNEWVKNDKYVGSSSSLHRIFHTQRSGRPAPQITTQERQRVVAAGQSVTLQIEATGAGPLQYQWQRDGDSVEGANSPQWTIERADERHDGATYRCVVSNRHGTTKSPPIRLWLTELYAPVEVPHAEPGISFAAFAWEGGPLPDFTRSEAFAMGTAERLAPAQGFQPSSPPGIAILYPVYIDVPADDVYTFTLDTKATARLHVAGQEVLVTRGTDAGRPVSGHVGLRAGRHPFLFIIAEIPANPRLDLTISGGGIDRHAVSRYLVHAHDAEQWNSAFSPQHVVSRPRSEWQHAGNDRSLPLSLAIPDDPAELPPLLSQTGAFRSLETLQPSPGLVPYDVNAPLWSDGAAKRRWIALPGTAQITYDASGPWKFPAGTVLIKHFELAGRRLETRFLYVDRSGSGWGATYRWREDGSDAELLHEPLDEEIAFERDGQTQNQRWYFPGRTDCLTCHTDAAGFVLGVNARQLAGRDNDSLRTWTHLEMFGNPPPAAGPPLGETLARLDDASVPLAHRVRSYLDANCAQCHRPGVVRASFDARIRTPLAEQKLIGENLLSADLGVGGARLIVPGQPEKSMLYLRMVRRGDALAMPPLASHEVDEEAAELLADWIRSLE